MKKSCLLLLVILLIFQLLPVAGYAKQLENSCSTLLAGSALTENLSFSITAKAVILYELNTKTLVYTRNPDERINPTGLVKLLTALIVLEEGNLEDVVTVKRSTLNSIAAGAVSAGLKAGEEIKLEDLLYCVMVSSANDAAAVMAEHVAGSQAAFVEKMNARAATLGCVNTNFTNVHGLKDDRQYSTARDLAIIAEEALKNERFCYFFGVTSHTVAATNASDTRNLKTTNYMMNSDSKYYDARVIGGKPAAAATADRSMICTAQAGESYYLCVVISAKAKTSGSSVTRYTNLDEAKSVLDMGFEEYAVQQVVGNEQPFTMYPVSQGENHVVVAPDRQVFALLPVKFQSEQIQFRDVRDSKALVAPLSAGTVVGTLQIYYGSILIGEADLVARHDVAPVGSSIMADQTDQNQERGLLGKIILCAILLVLVAGVCFAGFYFVPRFNKKRTGSPKNYRKERKRV